MMICQPMHCRINCVFILLLNGIAIYSVTLNPVFQAISKFESLVNQVQKNAKDINNRLMAMEKTVLFKRPPKMNGKFYMDAKVSCFSSDI